MVPVIEKCEKKPSPAKVAMIMGALTHSRQTSLYEDFDPRYDIIMVGARKCDIGESNIVQEHRRLLSKRDIMRKVPRIRNRIPWAYQQHLYGFEQAMSDVDILLPVGTIMRFAYQSILMKRHTGVKVVTMDLENVPLAYHNYPMKVQEERAVVLRESDVIVACTHQVKRCMVMEGVPEEKIRVIYHGVNTKRFYPGPKDKETLNLLGCDENDIVVMFVGQFNWRKGAQCVLFAAKCLAMDPELKDYPVKFVFVGNGEVDDMRLITKLYGLEDIVRIRTWVPHSQMLKVYQCSDIVTIPSVPIPQSYEQTSNALHEAASVGKAIVGSLSGCIPELLGDAALYFPPADYYAMYEQIKAMVINEAKRQEMAERARRRTLDCLDAAIGREQLAHLFDELLSE